MAKDTEKLIRQLSLISYLMAERRPGHGAGDPPRRRGLQRHERGRLRPALLRRPLRARLARDRAHRRRAPPTASPSRRTTRCARRTSTCPAIAFSDAELAALQTALIAARRRVRLRRAAAPGAAADLLGPAEPPARARAALGRARHHRVGRRPRPLPAAGQGRDGDLPQQDDHLRLLHDGARRDRHAQGGPVPPALPGRAVLPARPLARARRAARLPPLAHPREGRLRDQGRARLQEPPRRASTRAPTPTGPTGSSATRSARPRSWSPSASPGRSSATSGATARSGRGARADEPRRG